MKHTTEQHMVNCGHRSDEVCFCNFSAWKEALNACVDDFASKMKEKLEKAHMDGRFGWDDEDWGKDCILQQLSKNIESGDMVDVANFAMFAWNQSDGKVIANMPIIAAAPELLKALENINIVHKPDGYWLRINGKASCQIRLSDFGPIVFHAIAEWVEKRETIIAKTKEEIKETKQCRVCGCTDDKACPGGCHWIEDDLCSRCKS